MSDFNALKKKSKTSFADLTAKLEKETKQTYTGDPRYWTITRDAAGNGNAVIRFLPPAPDDDENYWIKIIKNYTKGPSGKHYNELSRANLGTQEADPFKERKSELWNASEDENSSTRKAAKLMQRKQSWHSNIYVVKDPGNPENEGKVFLFSYGKTIFDKLNDAMFPVTDEYETKEPFNPFDLWEGANFVIRVYKDGEWPSYDKSSFIRQSVLIDTGNEKADNSRMEAIWNSEYKLSELISADKLKSYDELKKKLYQVLELDGDGETNQKKTEPKVASAKPSFAEKVETSTKESAEDPDDDEVDLEAFRKMMEES